MCSSPTHYVSHHLYKHDVFFLRNAVTAQPKLFFVDRLLQGFPDQPVIRRIIIDITDRALAILIFSHM